MKILNITSHRNGITGTAFTSVKFQDNECGTLVAIVTDNFFGVIDPTNNTENFKAEAFESKIRKALVK